MANDVENKNDGSTSACGCGGGSCCSGPGKWIWLILILAIAGVMLAKGQGKKNASAGLPTAPAASVADTNVAAGAIVAKQSIPLLVDLGATKCIPCKMMAPILEELKSNYVGRLDVKFIDVWENPDEKQQYGINLIPTQIFYDAQGKELFRHEGFFSKEDILEKWKEYGVDLIAGPPQK